MDADQMNAMRAVVVPERMRRLKVDPVRGIPVPWFTPWVDGKPFVDVDTPQVTRRLADDREFVAWETEFRERRARMGIPRPPVV